jgi:hypothetical protein
LAKRYVLFFAEKELTEDDVESLSRALEERYGKTKVIPVKGVPRAVVVRTTERVAPLLRDRGEALRAGSNKLTPVLTSGGIGKLKRRAAGTPVIEIGEVHE